MRWIGPVFCHIECGRLAEAGAVLAELQRQPLVDPMAQAMRLEARAAAPGRAPPRRGRLRRAAIAEALFVTPKTVEFHLRQTYLKLDVASRDGLTQVLLAA